jgi:hypothetical protein
MSDIREDLIAELSTGLQPARPPLPLALSAGLWLLLSACFVIAITHWFGPIRPTALSQLATEPRFLLETLLGVLAISYTTVVAFRAAIPGALTRRSALIGAGLMLLWLANYLIGLLSPALAPSMLGKRPHCVVETLLFGLPLAGLAFIMSRRLYSLRPVYTASLFGLAAGMLPALYMQIACMYVPLHILTMHILPGLLVAVVSALCVYVGLWLRQRLA